MSINEAQRHHLKRFIKELEKHRGRHTELVSVYIPAGYDMNKIINHLGQEQGTAVNIKSASTKKNVIDALERMIQHLRLFKRTPEHGLAVFSGNVAEREGQSDVKVWSIEPPVPLQTRIYRCDKEFVVSILAEMMESKEVYGLVVIDRRDAAIAFLKGKTIQPMVKTHSEVPGKFRAGGQSAARFARQREGAIRDHFKKVADYMKEQFLNAPHLKGILVGGPGPTKYDFVDSGTITDQVKQKIIAIKDLSYTEDFGLQELVDKSQDVLSQEGIAEEKAIMNKLFEMLAKHPNAVAYGFTEVMKRLEMGAVAIVLVSEAMEDEKIEKIEEEAKRYSSEVKIISVETREGVQLKDIGKIAAILRYEIQQ